MNVQAISFRSTGAFSALANDFLDKPEKFADWLPLPFSMAGIQQAMEQRVAFGAEQRELLVAALKRQYAALPKQQLPASQLERLGKEGVFTITTAHQPNLFTGPAYLIYKIAGTIALARALESEGWGQFVPVYWMGAEDHDFEELNHTHVFGKRIEWQTQQTGAVGRMLLNDLTDARSQLLDILGKEGHAADLAVLIEACYIPEITVAEATRRFIDQLFGLYGLVVVDGDDASLKAQFVPQMQMELTEKASEALVLHAASKLEGAGYKAQIYPREINLFWLDAGIRERIITIPSGFALAHGSKTWTNAEMLEALQKSPECFSPNVVLRPLYQELILPNVAFIGGGAEVAYWNLLPKVFEKYQVPFPVVMLRTSAMVVDKGSLNRQQKLGLDTLQLFEETEQLIRNFIATHESGLFSLQAESAEMQGLFERLASRVEQVDPTLKAAVMAEAKKLSGSFEGLQARVIKAQKQKHETEVNQIRALKAKLFPENHLQERHDSFMNFYAWAGRDFIDTCVREMNPLRKEFLVLS
jgi:bacillithiol biosynthesis cysteine-adding enzyme BshC